MQNEIVFKGFLCNGPRYLVSAEAGSKCSSACSERRFERRREFSFRLPLLSRWKLRTDVHGRRFQTSTVQYTRTCSRGQSRGLGDARSPSHLVSGLDHVGRECCAILRLVSPHEVLGSSHVLLRCSCQVASRVTRRHRALLPSVASRSVQSKASAFSPCCAAPR